jgi:hypothetical protein
MPTHITFQDCQNLITWHKLILNTYTPTYVMLKECKNLNIITPQLNSVLLLGVSVSKICYLNHQMAPLKVVLLPLKINKQ